MALRLGTLLLFIFLVLVRLSRGNEIVYKDKPQMKRSTVDTESQDTERFLDNEVVPEPATPLKLNIHRRNEILQDSSMNNKQQIAQASILHTARKHDGDKEIRSTGEEFLDDASKAGKFLEQNYEDYNVDDDTDYFNDVSMGEDDVVDHDEFEDQIKNDHAKSHLVHKHNHSKTPSKHHDKTKLKKQKKVSNRKMSIHKKKKHHKHSNKYIFKTDSKDTTHQNIASSRSSLELGRVVHNMQTEEKPHSLEQSSKESGQNMSMFGDSKDSQQGLFRYVNDHHNEKQGNIGFAIKTAVQPQLESVEQKIPDLKIKQMKTEVDDNGELESLVFVKPGDFHEQAGEKLNNMKLTQQDIYGPTDIHHTNFVDQNAQKRNMTEFISLDNVEKLKNGDEANIDKIIVGSGVSVQNVLEKSSKIETKTKSNEGSGGYVIKSELGEIKTPSKSESITAQDDKNQRDQPKDNQNNILSSFSLNIKKNKTSLQGKNKLYQMLSSGPKLTNKHKNSLLTKTPKHVPDINHRGSDIIKRTHGIHGGQHSKSGKRHDMWKSSAPESNLLEINPVEIKHSFIGSTIPENDQSTNYVQYVSQVDSGIKTTSKERHDKDYQTVEELFSTAKAHKRGDCLASDIHYDVSLKGQTKAGHFAAIGRVVDVYECMDHCCSLPTCDVALMVGGKCFGVTCFNHELCRTVPVVHSDIVQPHLAYMSRTPGPQSVVREITCKYGDKVLSNNERFSTVLCGAVVVCKNGMILQEECPQPPPRPAANSTCAHPRLQVEYKKGTCCKMEWHCPDKTCEYAGKTLRHGHALSDELCTSVVSCQNGNIEIKRCDAIPEKPKDCAHPKLILTRKGEGKCCKKEWKCPEKSCNYGSVTVQHGESLSDASCTATVSCKNGFVTMKACPPPPEIPEGCINPKLNIKENPGKCCKMDWECDGD